MEALVIPLLTDLSLSHDVLFSYVVLVPLIILIYCVQATFKITLEVPSELIALSNMPVIQEKLDGHLKIVSFQESPIMSTYLVAVVVGLFDYIEGMTPDGMYI